MAVRMKVAETLCELRSRWSTPRPASHRGKVTPMALGVWLALEGASAQEVASLAELVPPDLRGVWQTCRSARLFEDVEYGQWGLELLDPLESTAETERLQADRPEEFRAGDRVVGRFLGDSDLLLVRCDPAEDDFGEVVVALPIDPRGDWYFLRTGLADFLEKYSAAEGDKFWEGVIFEAWGDPPLPPEWAAAPRYAILLLPSAILSNEQLRDLAKILDFGGRNLLQIRKVLDGGHAQLLVSGLREDQLDAVTPILRREATLHEILLAELAGGSPLAERVRPSLEVLWRRSY